MNNFKVAGLIAVSHLSKMLVSLFIIRQIAISQGPAGLGLLGNFMSLATIASSLAGGGVISGIIKYVSEYSSSRERLSNFVGNALLYILCASVVILIIGVVLVKPLTYYIFLNQEYSGFIYFFLIAQFFIALNNFSFGVVNGLRKNGLYALFVITGNLISIVIAFYCIKYSGMWGAIIAIMAPLVTPFFPAFVYVLTQRPLPPISFKHFYQDSRLLSNYSLMLVVSAVCFPVVEMIVRNLIINQIGLDAAGFWQAITRISAAYLSFYSLFLTFYFVPTLSSLTEQRDIYREVKKMLRFIGSLFVLMAIIFFFFKKIIIYYLLSEDFVSISDLFMLQMVGDFFRVLGWVIGFVVVVKAATKLYIFGEIIQGTIFLLFSYIELSYYADLRAVVIAYIATCILYCMIAVSVFYCVFREKQTALIVE